ncbi:hypothetical protein HMPREF3214_00199 [Alloscardovia omnicolens]|nr:hypothetical protein HMPREF3214_00199 [Alloscardovia omnicolens]
MGNSSQVLSLLESLCLLCSSLSVLLDHLKKARLIFLNRAWLGLIESNWLS